MAAGGGLASLDAHNLRKLTPDDRHNSWRQVVVTLSDCWWGSTCLTCLNCGLHSMGIIAITIFESLDFCRHGNIAILLRNFAWNECLEKELQSTMQITKDGFLRHQCSKQERQLSLVDSARTITQYRPSKGHHYLPHSAGKFLPGRESDPIRLCLMGGLLMGGFAN